jgi:hypothetical protein
MKMDWLVLLIVWPIKAMIWMLLILFEHPFLTGFCIAGAFQILMSIIPYSGSDEPLSAIWQDYFDGKWGEH